MSQHHFARHQGHPAKVRRRAKNPSPIDHPNTGACFAANRATRLCAGQGGHSTPPLAKPLQDEPVRPEIPMARRAIT
jgi:hypothetical protein